ncbi:MAG: hypothetical protein AB7K24_24885 [Gemmataceae bacterium]
MNAPCPSCQRLVVVPPNLIGQQVRCPGCATVFVAPEVPTAVPVSDAPAAEAIALLEPEAELPVPASISPDTALLRSFEPIRTGLWLSLIALVLLALALLALVVLVGYDFRRLDYSRENSARWLKIFGWISLGIGLLTMTSWMSSLLASCFWIFAGGRPRVQALGLAMVIFAVVTIVQVPSLVAALPTLIQEQNLVLGNEEDSRLASYYYGVLLSFLCMLFFEQVRVCLLPWTFWAISAEHEQGKLADQSRQLGMFTIGVSIFLPVFSVLLLSLVGGQWSRYFVVGLNMIAGCVILVFLLSLNIRLLWAPAPALWRPSSGPRFTS